ncbi:glycosyltransferase family 4 protein [Flavobacterium sp. ARAG 55.4]|uniref:glycosyltransferase family 4 protein n=1 Tax=Flavobacterium sp. ARAG 55.4 TaxID=3451357 RepID=UPI003F448FD9
MKILHIINNLATGGAEKLILETLPLLKERGIAVDLLVLDDTEYPYLKQLKSLNCCTIYSIGKSFVYNPLLIFRIIPYLKNYDLVHVHLFPVQYWVAIAKVISFSETKLIFTEHSTSNRRMKNLFFKILDKYIYRLYDKMVCITQEVEEALIRHTNLNNNRFVVIENGINLNSISKAVVLEKSKIWNTILNTDKLLIQIAGFRVEKDQKTLIKAMQCLDVNVKLLLVGEGILRNECEKLVIELDLQKRVFFLGVRIDVPALLKTADISVISSHWEGFGLAAVEGMAAGKPVIASDVPGLSNVVNGGGILFEKGNEKQLATIINKLLTNVDYYDTVGKAGLEKAKRYDIRIMVDKQIELYNEVLNL